MKNLLKIFSAAFAAFLLASCVEELTFSEKPQFVEGPVTLNLSVTIPEASASQTKALGEKTGLSTLYLVVFDQNGYLVESREATNLIQNDKLTEFAVTLTASNEKRIIHLIGDHVPANISYGSEEQVIGSMVVKPGEDAYWQRIVMPNGIQDNDANGELDVDKDKLTRVPLVRNFAKITVKVDPGVSNFKLVKFAVVNTYDHGSVAPYNLRYDPTTQTTPFPEYLKIEEGNPVQKSYDELLSMNYEGFAPASTEKQSTYDWVEVDKVSSFYTYERRVSARTDNPDSWKETPSKVLVAGYYNGNTTNLSFYQLDLIRKNAAGMTEFLNILRNFEYLVNIKSVTDDGYDTPEAALAGITSNNLSGAIDTRGLYNISDGISRLFVEYNDKTLVKGGTVALKFKFIPDIKEKSVVDNDVVKFYSTSANAGSVLNLNEDGSLIYTKDSSDDKEGWRTVYFSSKAPSDKVREESISVVTNTSTSGLERNVNYRLMQKMRMTLDVPDEVKKTSQTPFTAKLYIPDQINEAMFPLEFSLEASELSIYPNSEKNKNNNKPIPVVVSESLINGSSDAFHYVRTLTYSEYSELETDASGMKILEIDFKTNKDASASYVYAFNEYFYDAKDFFINPGGDAPVDPAPSGVYKLEISQPYVGLNQDANVSFEVSDDFSGDIIINVVGLGLSQSDIASSTGKIIVRGDGNIVYTPNGSGSQTVKFKTASELEDVTVRLRFGENESESVQTTQSRLKYNFNLKLDKETVGLTSEDLKVTFDMPVIETIDMTLVGLTVPADSRFKTDGGKVSFTPSKTGPQTITFKTTAYATDKTKSVSVTLSHKYFEPEPTATAKRKFVLTINSSTITNAKNGYNYKDKTLYIYTEGNQYDSPAGYVTMNKNGGISSGSVDVEYYDETDIIYFQYESRLSYRASATIESLLKGGVTLNFSANL